MRALAPLRLTVVLALATSLGWAVACGHSDDGLPSSDELDSGTLPPNDAGARPDTNTSEGDATAAKTFCDGIFGAIAAKYDSCCTAAEKADGGPSAEYKTLHDDVVIYQATCVDELTSALKKRRVTYDPVAGKTCLDTYATVLQDCGTFRKRLFLFSRWWLDPACSTAFKGSQAEGSACAFSGECADGLTCVGWSAQSEGLCKKPPALGEKCGAASTVGLRSRIPKLEPHPGCAPGGYCPPGPSGTCQPALAADASCAEDLADEACNPPNVCYGHTCKVAPATRSPVGAPCGRGAECVDGTFCNPSLDAGTFDGFCADYGAAGTMCTSAGMGSACAGDCNLNASTCTTMCGSK